MPGRGPCAGTRYLRSLALAATRLGDVDSAYLPVVGNVLMFGNGTKRTSIERRDVTFVPKRTFKRRALPRVFAAIDLAEKLSWATGP